MVEFAVGPECFDACQAAVKKTIRDYVTQEPAFHSIWTQRQEDAGTLWDIMKWDSHRAFFYFQDGIGFDRIGKALGEFGPASRMLDIVAVVEPDRYGEMHTVFPPPRRLLPYMS